MSENFINLDEFSKKSCQYLNTPVSERKRKDPHVHEPYYQRKLICDDVLDAVGNTPLIRINNITKHKIKILQRFSNQAQGKIDVSFRV